MNKLKSVELFFIVDTILASSTFQGHSEGRTKFYHNYEQNIAIFVTRANQHSIVWMVYEQFGENIMVISQ